MVPGAQAFFKKFLLFPAPKRSSALVAKGRLAGFLNQL
jgi:hypothetical protein